MQEQTTFTSRSKEARLFRRRLLIAIIIIGLCSFLLVGRLFYLQVLQYKHYTTLSTNNEIDIHPLPPRRGLIFDRAGLLLAKNIPVFDLDVRPSKVQNINQTINAVNKIIPLTNTDIELFKKQLGQHRRFDQVPLKLKLTPKEVAIFAVNRYQFPGVTVKAELIREYPLYNAYAHVLGYVGRINEQDLTEVNPTNYAGTNFIGKVGIEKYYESVLHGTVGYERAETNAAGQILRQINTTPPTQGTDLYLTIDTPLQIAAEQALKNDRGAVVAIQPSTGQILALVSQPGYNPNLFVNGISSKDFKTLQNDPNFPMYNRALRGLFAPGSVVKPLVALAGLDSHVTTPSFQLYDPGWYKVPGTEHIFHDWKLTGHGWVNLTKAITISCDTYFFDLSHKLGIKRIDYMFRQFGFGKLTGIDMDEELPGNVPTPAWKLRNKGSAWYSGDTVQVGIGQGFLQITPLQLAAATATIANRGKRYLPHLLYEEKLPDGELLKQPPTEEDPVILQDPKDWNIVINAMTQVIPEGTGFRFGRTPYTVAAKTGTAQLFSVKHDDNNPAKVIPVRLRNNSTFIAFAPANNPKIAIAVVDQNNVTAPIIARKVLDEYLLKENHLKDKSSG